MNAPASTSLVYAACLGMSVAIGHGIGRFGYALVMPSMQTDLGWGYEQASWINTANALGYVLGTISGYLLLNSVDAKRLFQAGVWMVALSLPLMAFDGGMAWFILLRLLSGCGAAWSFSTGGALVSKMYEHDPRRKGTATGLFFGGAGIGMVMTAATGPAIIAAIGDQGWPHVWVIHGLAALALIWLPLLAAGRPMPHLPPGSVAGRLQLSGLSLQLLAYFGFAVAHTGYLFFVFAWAKTQSLPWQHGASMWALLGVCSFVSAWIWQRALSSWKGETVLATCCLACAAGALLPALSPTLPMMYISAALMGGSVFIGPGAMTALVRQTLPAAHWGKSLMGFSLVFAVWQSLGSWAFGRAADLTSLTFVLGSAAAGLLISSLFASFAAMRRKVTPSLRVG